MEGNKRYISRFKHVLIVLVASLLVLFVYMQFFSDVINNYNWNVSREQAILLEQATGKPYINFGPPGYQIGAFHLVSVLVLLALVFGRKFYIALLMSLAYFVTLLYAHYSQVRDFESVYAWQSDAFNLVAFVFLLLLLIWELSIVLRVMRHSAHFPKLD